MALTTNKLAAATAVAAAFSMLSTPAAAIELPHKAPVAARGEVHDADAGTAYDYRHRRWRGRDRDNDIDAGDVIAGVLVLGGLAAILGAGKDRDDEPYRYPEDARYRTPEPEPRYGSSSGIDRAVDVCTAEIANRGARVGSVESAARTGDGWQVAGELDDGASFACWIDDGGQVSDVEIGTGYEASTGAPGDGQWSDEAYARARSAQEAGALGG